MTGAITLSSIKQAFAEIGQAAYIIMEQKRDLRNSHIGLPDRDRANQTAWFGAGQEARWTDSEETKNGKAA